MKRKNAKRNRTIDAVDMFCGAGGTSSGLLAACKAMGIELNLIAINHWPVAIDTHRANHEYAQHLCSEADDLNPRKLLPTGRLHVLVASPECTHHSNARGGRPMSDQSRATAWHVLRWAEALYIENILIENVKEFRSWGPLGANGRPVKRLKGQLYLQFINSLKALGYRVEDKILNAADYGDPTTRERLFVIARRGNRPIVWPAATHASALKLKKSGGQRQMFAGRELQPWRTAREIIDWSIPGKSIFERKRPLAPKTIARIAAGIEKFCGEYAEPFLILLRGTSKTRSVDEPMPTVTGGGRHVGLVEPFILGQMFERTASSVDVPLRTITTISRLGLVEPFIIPNFGEREGQEPRTHSLDAPLPAVTGHGAGALVEPFIIGAGGPERAGKPRGVNSPMATILTKNMSALVEPFMLNIDHQTHGDSVRSVDSPVPTITTKARTCLVEPFLLTVNHGDKANEKNPHERRSSSLDEPMPTVTTNRGTGLVQPFVVKYNGTAKAQSVDEPLDTVSTRDRFGLVETEAGTFRLDIRFRMLEPHELAAAQGLAGYKFTGKKTDVVKQIGNAVPKGLATSLCAELIV